jgi:uncharacterized membrane protein
VIALPVFFLIAVFLFMLLRGLWTALFAPIEEVKSGRSRSEFMKWGFPAKH